MNSPDAVKGTAPSRGQVFRYEGFAVDGSFRIEIRDSYIHDVSWPEPGGAGPSVVLSRSKP